MLLPELFALAIVTVVIVVFCYTDVNTVFFPKLQAEKTFQHLTFASMFAIFILWSAQAGIKQGLDIHFLALTTLCLMYGWKSAFTITIPITFGLALFGTISFYHIPVYLLVSSLIPILVSYLVFELSYRFLPRNIFVFIFVAGFFNAAFTGSIHLVVNALWYSVNDAYTWPEIVDNYLVFLPLLAFPEGLLNGMSVALLCVFKPEWLRTFSDRDYLYPRNSQK
ncbi:energy-coupling factor ABC transporter permease [Vibrio sp. SCSIO 43135]|uniref:Energy-coupling factor ABC transporter permease n=1 Tax=Vibrio paucivorans TaxID=2829489 RepID=A0A9X3CGM2_9VIBR|nr:MULTISPECIES: energy-coupling factor ABC transporter permease [Vibrio]MCW8335522.1 energy-coupling factor ABC transporter permease [Vibrio paucivorans]USD40228.1 energy-coupling factor ABC transporter permease [Vibrio sp. SCSIO 43135]